MSKISNALTMYQLLLRKRGQFVSVEELATALEIKPRMIKDYKAALCHAGIDIQGKTGLGGGYALLGAETLPFLPSPKEKEILGRAMDYLRENRYMEYERFSHLMDQRFHAANIESGAYQTKSIRDSEQVIKKRRRYFPMIWRAIQNRHKIDLTYHSLSKDQQTVRVVWPIKIIEYLESDYMAAYAESEKGFRFFKLSRIVSLEELDQKYTLDAIPSLENELKKSYGLFMGEPMMVDLMVYRPFHEIIQEKCISSGQNIQIIDQNTIRFTAEMTGKEEIESWILGMGEHVKVLGSEELKASLKERIQKMQSLY